MATYEDLRRDCIETLTRAGELRALSAEERRTLERGSLAVFGSLRARTLKRGQAFLRTTLALSVAALALGLTLGIAPPRALPADAPVFVLLPAFATLLALLAAQVVLVRKLARRREIYSELTASVLAYAAD